MAFVHTWLRQLALSHDLLLLFVSRVLMRISLSSLAVFLPVYFYTAYGESITMVVVIFALLYLVHVLIIPLATRLIGWWGLRNMMLVGMLAAAFGVFALFLFQDRIDIATVLFVIATAIYRALYWVPYQVDFAELLDPARRGSQLALLRNVSAVLVVLSPLIGGALIMQAGFAASFIYAGIVMIAAMLPLFFLTNHTEEYSWGYLETFVHLLRPENRPLVLAHAANGAQSVATIVFWPLFLSVLFDGQLDVVGVITSVTLVVVMLLRALVGKLFDRLKRKKQKILFAGVVLSASGWFLKAFVNTPVEVVVVDAYHQMGQTVSTLAFDAATYEQSADAGRFVDEYTVIKEQALNLGRVAMLLIVGTVAWWWGIQIAFIFAAVVTFAMVFLSQAQRLR